MSTELPQRRVYISGPMTGCTHHNFPAFHVAAERLRAAGWDVVNPAENFNGRTDLPRETYLRADVAALTRCDAIAMLPDWEKSSGAKLEYLIARELNMQIIDIATLAPMARRPEPVLFLVHPRVTDDTPSKNPALPRQRTSKNETPAPEASPPENILVEAQRLTDGCRHADYGHPRADFARAAAIWTGILRPKLREEATILPGDIPLCMIAIKLSRQAHRHKRDNLVDIAGYARTAAMVAGEED